MATGRVARRRFDERTALTDAIRLMVRAAGGVQQAGALLQVSAATVSRHQTGDLAIPYERAMELAARIGLHRDDSALLRRLLTERDTAPAAEPADVAALDRYSRLAVAAAGHQGGSAPGEAVLDLNALAVPRDLEWSLLALLRRGGSGCVTGAPGAGKTTLLWRLHGQLAADPDGPRPYFLRAGDLWQHGGESAPLPLAVLRAACRHLARRAVFLLDTTDLLVAEETGLALLADVLALAAEHGLPVLLTCREREARILRPAVEDFDLVWKQLGPYSPREQEAAVRSHARWFYGGQPEVSVDEICRTVTGAAVKGLPMREVCQAPLTLRMLFEVFAPRPPDVREIDATALYDLYWQHRVRQDRRAGTSAEGPGTADLSEAGEGLAELMLEDGRLEIPEARIGTGPPTGTGSADDEARTRADLLGLVARGVLDRQESGTDSQYAYTHQTLFEFAAGRRLCRLTAGGTGDPIRLLLDWLREHPHDQFRLAVAEQALVQAGRGGGRAAEECTAVLTELAAETAQGRGEDHELHGLRALLLRVYARLPAPGPALRAVLTPLVAALPTELARVYLEALPATCHRDGERLAAELVALWRGGERTLRWPLVEVLTRLAESFTDSVVAVVDGSCPAAPGRCRGTRCEGTVCLWAWLLTRQEAETTRVLHLLEALADKRPDWVWPRLRTFLADPTRKLLPLARALRLAARRQDWPERPYRLARPIVRHRWPGAAPTGQDGMELQSALGRLTASGWLARPAARMPDAAAVLADAARDPQSLVSHAKVRAVGELALGATTEEATRHLVTVLAQARPATWLLFTDGYLRPLLTADRPTADTVGGDTPSTRTARPEPAATAVVRDWLVGRLRALDRPRPTDDAHGLAVHTWSRHLDTATAARLAAEAWPAAAAGAERRREGRPRSAAALRRIWLDDAGAATLLVAAATSGHRHALDALRLWREDRAREAAPGPYRETRVDRLVTHSLQRLLPDHPELLDLLFADGMIDPHLDPGWLCPALRLSGADDRPTGGRPRVSRNGTQDGAPEGVDPRLTAALRRHAAALERLCDLTWTGAYGDQMARQPLQLRAGLAARGVLDPPEAERLRETLAKGGHPFRLKALLMLVRTVVEHTPSGELATDEWRRFEDDLRDFAGGVTAPRHTGDSRRWVEEAQGVARACLTGLLCLHHPLDTPRRATAARRAALVRLAEAGEVADVIVVGRLLERLALSSPGEAVLLFGAVADRLSGLPTGSVAGLTKRWYRPVSLLAGRADRAQWESLVEASWRGPEQLQRLLIRASIRKRDDDPAAHLLATAELSGAPGMTRETVRIGTRLHAQGSRRRWTALSDARSAGRPG
ncbi:hypothetical protein BX265_7627 [Streptomyces sp. TLI_235]|nr:hypothetical protein [Streptomyces sp. TLI_235]PBC70231.1 hypothetical protein BX265_7627 [Streptomyces sp. TLI_235]